MDNFLGTFEQTKIKTMIKKQCCNYYGTCKTSVVLFSQEQSRDWFVGLQHRAFTLIEPIFCFNAFFISIAHFSVIINIVSAIRVCTR